ncbi:hypothetical protein [Streptomyces sp. TRM49041]|uniref:hypothetical protein n=1 Tax=Streptomyces sp. TRM49041 TaxID=2603216 RepID=UPI0021CC9E00|nr:hypothetical protein [Streptomyces sp. TRM49041]
MAVFGVVLVALTGARGSGGGSCGGSSSSSSSSSSGGNHGGDTDNGGSGSSGGGSVSGGGGSSSNRAIRDIRIDECKLDATGKNLVARLTVTNDSSLDYDYDVTVQFKGDAGQGVTVATARVNDLAVTANGSKSTEAGTPYTGTGNGSEYSKCVVSSANRTMS